MPNADDGIALPTAPTVGSFFNAHPCARGISNAMVIRLAMDAFENPQPGKEIRNA